MACVCEGRTVHIGHGGVRGHVGRVLKVVHGRRQLARRNQRDDAGPGARVWVHVFLLAGAAVLEPHLWTRPGKVGHNSTQTKMTTHSIFVVDRC